MKRSYFTTLGLFAAFIVLIGWYFIYEKKFKGEFTQKEEKTKQFVSLEKEKISEFTLEKAKNPPNEEAEPPTSGTPEYEKVRLKKIGDGWNIVEPVSDQADAGAVSSLLGSLISTKHDRVVDENPKDLALFGLKDPIVKITVLGEGAASETVLIGRKTPVGYGVYVKKADAPKVYKASQSLRSSLEKTVKDLRNKSILSWPRGDVAEVEIAKLNLVLKKGEKDGWWLSRENLPADTNETNKLLNTLTDLRVSEFVSEDGKDLKRYTLDKPQLQIVLANAKDKSRLTLSFSQNGGKTYARREDKPNVYEIPSENWSKLSQPADKYRNLEVASFNRFDIKRVKIERDKETLEFLKEGSDWTFPTEPSFKVDNSKVDTFLTKLQDVRLIRYGGASSIPKKPDLIVRLFEKKDATETEKVVLKFGPMDNSKEIAIERAGLGIGFFVKASDFQALSQRKSDFAKVEPPKPTETPKPEKTTG